MTNPKLNSEEPVSNPNSLPAESSDVVETSQPKDAPVKVKRNLARKAKSVSTSGTPEAADVLAGNNDPEVSNAVTTFRQDSVPGSANTSDPTDTGALDVTPKNGTNTSNTAKLVVAAAATIVIGVSAGLGIVLLNQSQPLTNTSATNPASPAPAAPTPVAGDSDKKISFDDDLRQWNLNAAASISPLVSQLARAPRNTLGGQVSLCREQRAYLQSVLDLSTPPNKAIVASFERWRDSVRSTLDGCINTIPSGDDKADINRIVVELKETESYFASFLAAQQPFLEAAFEANPEAFEE